MHSAILIGEDSLLIQCGKILLAHNFWVVRIVSPIKSIQDWADQNNIPWVSKIKELLTPSLNKVDYIFSAVNSQILNSEILKLAKCATINYHDSLLPKYAGLNATTWALINGEKEHGITWHIVTNKIDEGDIVKQTKFSITVDDTAFSLNLRCYELAIQAFADLVIDIVNNRLTLIKQDLRHKSYFGLTAILPNFGFIDWNEDSAASISARCKATSLGHYNNNVGFMKIFLSTGYLIVSEVNEVFDTSNFLPGTIIEIQSDYLTIKTTQNAIKISRLLAPTGSTIIFQEFKEEYHLYVGMVFKSIKIKSSQFKELYRFSAKNEQYWVKQFKNLNAHITFTPTSLNKNKKLKKLTSSICLPIKLGNKDVASRKKIILSAILIYLYRLNDYNNVSVSLVYSAHKLLDQPGGDLFSKFLPMALNWNEDMDLESLVSNLSIRLNQQEKKHTFFSDIIARHPLIDKKPIASNIIINLTPSEKLILPPETLLYFQYDGISHNVIIHHAIDESYHSGLLLETLSNIASHIENIINHLLTKPHTKVSEFCFLTPKERNTLVNRWGKGEYYPLPQKNIYGLFEDWVNLTPDAPAIYMDNKVTTYKQLALLVDKTHTYIQKKNIAPQALIALYSPRNVEMIAVILGILKSNCIYVPLDTRYPLLKIEIIAREAQLTHMITTTALKKELRTHFSNKQSLQFHAIEAILSAKNSKIFPHLPVEINHPIIYIMFTSGTTGAPKGVVVNQKNVLNYCTWFIKSITLTSSSIVDFSSSIAFDLAIPCTLAPLIRGASIAICTEEIKSNPEFYLQHLIKYKVSHAELTPGYVEMLLHYPQLVAQLVNLKYLLLGADIVHTQEVKKWIALCPHQQIVNEYGPTETTVSITSYFVTNSDFIPEAAVPIGRPAINSTAYILDKRKNLCPIGMKGELYIGGAQVTNGYLGKPSLTETKFIPLSLNNDLEIYYKTGDLTAWLPKGVIQFFGRNDFQVKIQGYRIELHAIESVLLQMKEVKQAVIIVRQGHFKEKYLRAYIVLNNASLTLDKARNFIGSYLPCYMIPKEFCVTTSIPLKENEKIDFPSLEKQPFTLLGYAEIISESLTESEKITMRIWSQAFSVNDLGKQDNFFDLGGDSLLALHIINALNNFFKLNIPLSYLFEYPNISLLSEQIDQLLNIKITNYRNDYLPSKWIIPLSHGSNKIPLFLIHPVGGTVFWYKQLAKKLAGIYTIYGIQDASVDGDMTRFSTIEEMASFYIEKILEVYTGNDFALGGASFGATVAFEMAKQLMSSQKNIEYLGLFDGWTEYPTSLMKGSSSPLLIYQENNSTTLAELENYRKELLLKYEFSPLDTAAILYKAKELWQEFSMINKIDNGWSSIINGKLQTHLMNGNHETMLSQTNVDALANQIVIDLSRINE